MNPRVLRLVYETVSRLGINPALNTTDVPDGWLVDVVQGEHSLPPGRALDLGCGGGRNSILKLLGQRPRGLAQPRLG